MSARAPALLLTRVGAFSKLPPTRRPGRTGERIAESAGQFGGRRTPRRGGATGGPGGGGGLGRSGFHGPAPRARPVAVSGCALRVAHIHHGLRGRSADRDAALVAAAAERDGLPVSVVRLTAATRPRGTSVQVWARDARYAALEAIRKRVRAAWVLTAHTAERSSGDGAPESAARHRRARPGGDSRGARSHPAPAAGCLAGEDRRLRRAAPGRLPRRPVESVGRVPAQSDPTPAPPAARAGSTTRGLWRRWPGWRRTRGRTTTR